MLTWVDEGDAVGDDAVGGAAGQDRGSGAGEAVPAGPGRAPAGAAGGPDHTSAPRGSRTRFTRRRDWAVAGVLLAVVLVAPVVRWQTSEIAATTRQPATTTLAAQVPPLEFPPSLAETWRADSPSTPVPVVAGPVVATGNGGTVSGLDPLTGEVVWRYQRDLQLCTVAPFDTVPPQRTDSGTVLALYGTKGGDLPEDGPYADGNCSEVSAIDGGSGDVEATRNSDAEYGTRLLSDGTTVTTTGRRLITSWRSDLVMTSQYGTRPTPVQPRPNLRKDCFFGSVAVTADRIAVIERCPEDNGADRLTVYKTQTPSGKDNDDVEITSSTLLGARGRVIAVTDTTTAVALADPPRVRTYTAAGVALPDTPVDIPEQDLANTDPPGATAATTTGQDAVYWFTGSRTVALAKSDLRPTWLVPSTSGSGVVFAGKLLLPVEAGLAVKDPVTGADAGLIPVDRGGYRGPITMSTTGPIVLEQRGPTLVALR
ncbi:hypothetical protein BJP25_21560 [Actinokineospora bangkokensis]|uniref:PQQ-binding-like beta-propeller repeat protein n=1 Tax=Actinokineospora bangkokensis TaxID=1193682 RepID=A0A1Q9LL72_9PSEU|nr:hypothetical protein BJP25_21560 [Actinokineospora bangkokensis]